MLVVFLVSFCSCTVQPTVPEVVERSSLIPEQSSPTSLVSTSVTSLTPAKTSAPVPATTTIPRNTVASTLTLVQGASVLSTSACAITSPPSSMEGINTHTDLYGTGADPNIITLGPKEGGHPGWPTYEHKCGMSFEAYDRGSPVLAPFDMVLVGFRDTSYSYQNAPGGALVHADDVKLFFKSTSPDWPGVYMCVYHLLTSPLLTGHTQSKSNDLNAAPAQGYQLFWDGNYTVAPTNDAASYGALIGYKVKRGELIGFAGSVPTGNDKNQMHNFADFYFFVPDTSVNPNITKGNQYLHLVQPGSFFYWKSFSPETNFHNGVLAYPFECDGYQLPVEQRESSYKCLFNNAD
jgi:hypothetical protein